MLFDSSEISVEPEGECRIHDHIITRLDLRSIGEPDLTSAWFVLITMRASSALDDEVQGQTNGFLLTEIQNYQEIYRIWRKLFDLRRYERGYHEFLLRFLREGVGIRLEFHVRGDRISAFSVHLGNITLRGRFPEDGVDVLRTYFGGIETETD